MAIPIDPKQIVSFEELLMSQVVSQGAITRLLVEKGIFTKDEFLDMAKVVDREMKRKKKERREREEILETGAKKILDFPKT